ncbi:hypothetical protein [Burkholderia anthina]|uniref:hypothetical protein n=1 Tax=Burkholderia anthina TaxID=179879 RepID=UPI0037C094C7
MNLALGIHFGPRIALVAATLEQPSERHQDVLAALLRADPGGQPGTRTPTATAEAITSAIQSVCTKVSGTPKSITVVLNKLDGPDVGESDQLVSELRSALAQCIPSAENRVEIRLQPVAHGALQNLVFLPTGKVNAAVDFDNQTWVIAVIAATSSEYLVVDKSALTMRRNVGGHVSAEVISTEIRSSIAHSATLNGAFVVADPAFETAIRQVLPRVILPQAPEWAVAEGFCRYALFCASQQSS